MRMAILIAATLAACVHEPDEDDSGPCPNIPVTPFTLAEDLDESTIQALLAEANQTDPAKLGCATVCESFYEREFGVERGGFISADTCELTIENYPTGDPAAIVGQLSCEGKGYQSFCLGGRRPIGHIDRPLTDLGLPTFLAQSAHLEAASVLAFQELAQRLQQWGAPAALVERCRTAATEEAVHSELLGDLAREAGANVESVMHRELPVDLACAALDNAVEGCVIEAWSAVVCAVAARRADTPSLRRVYARLAADETSHAQLAWDLHNWFLSQVSTEQRVSILAAQQQAIANLPACIHAEHRSAPAALGLPGARTAAHFAAGLMSA